MIRVCFHGAESTGKSTLAQKLAVRFHCPLVPEYGRTHAETRGTAFTLADLLAMAREQDRLMREAARGDPPLLLLDTDPLMTAAWAEMLFGFRSTEWASSEAWIGKVPVVWLVGRPLPLSFSRARVSLLRKLAPGQLTEPSTVYLAVRS